jgi:mannose-6-phosphate isomerase-like protein (cupin superfamily)
MKLISLVIMAALSVPCYALQGGKAEVFPSKDVASELSALAQKAKASGSSGATLGEYKSHAIKLSVRTGSGGAEVHAHYDDIFFVTQGQATLVTGGTVLDAKTNADGETIGSKIQNGTSQTIAKGDVVHIPAGTPHQLLLHGDVFSAIVIKVKEAQQ